MEWLTHGLSALGGLAIGFAAFFLKWESLTTRQWRAIVADLRLRVAALEKRHDEMHNEHAKCLVAQIAMQAEIATLRKQVHIAPN